MNLGRGTRSTIAFVTEEWTITCRWLGRDGLRTEKIELDYLPEMLGQLSHPQIEDGASMQITSLSEPDHDQRAVNVGLSRPLSFPRPR